MNIDTLNAFYEAHMTIIEERKLSADDFIQALALNLGKYIAAAETEGSRLNQEEWLRIIGDYIMAGVYAWERDEACQ